jgi:hypothetical protein
MRRAFVVLEHALLLLDRQAREQRQDLDMRRMVLAQRLGAVADLALARQEHQHVALEPRRHSSSTPSTTASIRSRFSRAAWALGRLAGLSARRRRRVAVDRAVAHLDLVQAARHLDHRRRLVRPSCRSGARSGRRRWSPR